MDWTKAKSILIIALLLTDLILGGVYYYQHMDNEKPPEHEVEKILQFLEEHDIYVDTKLSEKVPRMPVLFVKYEDTDETQVEMVLKEQRRKRDFNLTENTARNLCDEVLKNCGFTAETLVYDSFRIDEEGAEVIYKNIYEGIPVEVSSIRCRIEEGRVTEVERVWLTPMGFGKKKQKVIQPTDALLQFMSEWAKKKDADVEGNLADEVHIEGIDLVYWLDTSTGPKDGVEDTALPAWRFLYNGGEVTFIEAYEQI